MATDTESAAPTYQQVVASWNAQADKHNQWEELGEDEKIEWAVACANAAPPTAQAEGWRGIATAPKDGSHIIAYRPSVPPHIEGMYWAAYEDEDIPGAWHWSCDGESPTNNPPTHWMPLPPPPTSSEGVEQANAARAAAAKALEKGTT